MPDPDKRIVVVGNPESSRAASIDREVLSVLKEEHVTHEVVQTYDDTAESLTKQLDSVLEPNDRLLFAGGDGMIALGVNALRGIDLERRNQIELGFMAYGNRCDGAEISGRAKRDTRLMISQEMKPRQFYPLSVTVKNRKLELVDEWLAASYVTVGDPTTGLAAEFQTPEVRMKLKGKRALFLRSAVEAIKFYHDHQGSLRDIASQHISISGGGHLPPRTTDLVMLNSSRMATAVRNTEAKCFTDRFRFGTFDLSSLGAVAAAYADMVRAHGMPGENVLRVVLDVAGAEALCIQSDGETRFIPKGSRYVHVAKLESERLTVLTHE